MKARLRSMLKLDFYRLFHTPAFYIMLIISAIIPAMILTMAGVESAGASVQNVAGVTATANVANVTAPDNVANVTAPAVVYANVWQLVESTGGSAVADNPLDFAGFANINMVFIFAGLLMAIFVAHDYMSGFVKNIFTVHSKKIDYVISKSAIGVFGGAGMILAYVAGAVVSGLITGKSFEVNVGSLVMCLISKTLLMGIFCSLFLGISVFFRDKLWLTIVFTFLFGMMLYPAASVATLSSTVTTMLLTLIAGAAGAAVFGTVSAYILNFRDLT